MSARLLAFCLSLLMATTAAWTHTQAFGTVEILGQHAEHATITRAALQGQGFGPTTLLVLAGGHGKFGAVGAADRPGRGYLSTDAAHCDNGDWLDLPGYPGTRAQAEAKLTSCRNWILDHIRAAVVAAGEVVDASGWAPPDQTPPPDQCRFRGIVTDPARCRVLENLGLALHASQDFYSHTNWTDDRAASGGTPSNPPGLGNSGPAPWLASRDAPFPTGLISGCYEGVFELIRCRYSGGRRVRHGDLSKDTGDIAQGVGATKRGKQGLNFRNAVAAASLDGRSRWLGFAADVRAAYPGARGEMILCRIRSDVPTTCGSVGHE